MLREAEEALQGWMVHEHRRNAPGDTQIPTEDFAGSQGLECSPREEPEEFGLTILITF